MDEYTQGTKLWLDERFRKCDEQGIYFAHQPIYGFRKGHCDPGYLYQYISTYQIMKALSRMEFDSLLDVGAAEGQRAYIANQIFGVKVRTTDLSAEACLRAREIFRIDSDPADVHQLPYEDNEFDVVLCSATLEHVTDYQKAIAELLRVASKAVVTTLPCEDRAVIEKNIEAQIPHAHIHTFTLDSLDYLTPQGYEVIKKKMACHPLLFLDSLVQEYPRLKGVAKVRNPRRLFRDFCLAPVWQKIYGAKVASLMVNLDALLCNFLSYYLMLFVVLKDKQCYYDRARQRISLSRIMSFTVPYHYLSGK